MKMDKTCSEKKKVKDGQGIPSSLMNPIFLFHRFQSSISNDVPGWETLSYTVDLRVFL
jgi:hypothetical protein